jgi:hypothetical protein
MAAEDATETRGGSRLSSPRVLVAVALASLTLGLLLGGCEVDPVSTPLPGIGAPVPPAVPPPPATTPAAGPPASPTSEEGSYALVQVDATALPVDMGPLGVRCPPIGTVPPCNRDAFPRCNQILTEGRLTLDEARGRFDYFYLTRNSCSGSVLSDSNNTGRYTRDGGLLHFLVDGIDMPPRYRGTVSGNAVAVDLIDKTLRFERATGRMPPLPAGRYPLVRVRSGGLTVPGVPAPPPPSACPLVIEGGLLTIEPLAGLPNKTGRFQLTYRLIDSCTGQSRQSANEGGTFEQVMDTLVFVGELGPNSVHPFHGSVAATEIQIHALGGDDLIFAR